MKNIYSLSLLLVVGMVAGAQKNDPDAKKILDGVSAKFKSFKTVQANFTYSVENGDGKSLSSKKGTVSMKGTKYRVTFNGQEIYCDGTTVWNYDKSSNEVTVSKLDAANGTITPQKLFTNFYDKDFLYTLNGEKKQAGKTLQEIQMTPTDKSKSFHTVYLLIDKISKTIYSTKVLEKTGDRYSYTVTSLKPNQPMDDKTFIFDKSKYPGVEVVDLQ
ncbi:MAG TPA: outer membrane lipoprotein carrier protein LolA [Chitinophagaceae bacterium]|nr:outer membrane lipoprotein carrier protein LolA [Chitinophagaceae bacterium]HVZ96330.1 outer membrane lipoprotein carrier protein LolA [Chitinophagaceae bacterium]